MNIGVKYIRVESDKAVTHYSTKYYDVKYNENIQTDELIIKKNNKIIAQVKPLSLSKTIISYQEICRY